MNFGNTKGPVVNYNGNQNGRKLKDPDGSNSESRFRGIMNRSRLTEEDLEQLRLSILEAHRKKNYRVLIISVFIILCVGIVLYYLAF